MREYKKMEVDCSLSVTSLKYAILKLGSSFIYTIYVHELYAARYILDFIMSNTKSETLKFLPQFNIEIESEFSQYEWCVGANGKYVGSKM